MQPQLILQDIHLIAITERGCNKTINYSGVNSVSLVSEWFCHDLNPTIILINDHISMSKSISVWLPSSNLSYAAIGIAFQSLCELRCKFLRLINHRKDVQLHLLEHLSPNSFVLPGSLPRANPFRPESIRGIHFLSPCINIYIRQGNPLLNWHYYSPPTTKTATAQERAPHHNFAQIIERQRTRESRRRRVSS